MGVAAAPVVLQFPDGTSARSQLVYAPHDYGPDDCGQGCPWFNATTSYDSLAALWEQNWGYIVDDPTKPYAAPVFIGEFGTCNDQQNCVSDTTPGSQGQWFTSLVSYIASKHVSWAYWSANGTRSTSSDAGRAYGERDRYGLFSANWTTPAPWIQAALRPIQTDPAQGMPDTGG
jgi:endoglucanase